MLDEDDEDYQSIIKKTFTSRSDAERYVTKITSEDSEYPLIEKRGDVWYSISSSHAAWDYMKFEADESESITDFIEDDEYIRTWIKEIQ